MQFKMFEVSKLKERVAKTERDTEYFNRMLDKQSEIINLLLNHLGLKLERQPEKLILKPKDVSREDSKSS